MNSNIQKIYFISGVSGSGKTSTMVHLKKMLPPDVYDVRDLDEHGVPDGGGLEWLNNETRYWLDVAKENAKQGKSTIICGFANPELFNEVYRPEEDIPAELILLNVSPANLEARLRGRHNTLESVREIERASGVSLEKFIEDNKKFVSTLKEIFQKNGYSTVETDGKTPEEVSSLVVKVMRG